MTRRDEIFMAMRLLHALADPPICETCGGTGRIWQTVDKREDGSAVRLPCRCSDCDGSGVKVTNRAEDETK